MIESPSTCEPTSDGPDTAAAGGSREYSHFLLRLQPLQRSLTEAVARRRLANQRLRDGHETALFVSEHQVTCLLDRVDQTVQGRGPRSVIRDLPGEAEREIELRRTGRTELPLDGLRHFLGLDCFEIDAVLLCAAVELESAFGGLYGYLLDDMNRRFPCPELILALAHGDGDRGHLLARLGPQGRLRRKGLLVPIGDAPAEVRQELRLGPNVLDYLFTGVGDPTGLFRDRAEVEIVDRPAVPPGIERRELDCLGLAIGEGALDLAGIWGTAGIGVEDAAHAVAAATGRPIRRLVTSDVFCVKACPAEETRKAVQSCSVLGAVLLVDIDELRAAAATTVEQVLSEELASCRVPAILYGHSPWLPIRLLSSRSFAEVRLPSPNQEQRVEAWSDAVSGLAATDAADLAARYRLGPGEMRAAASVAETRARLAEDPSVSPRGHLEEACTALAHQRSHSFATVVTPRRRADDLILPTDLHAEVLEVAGFYRAWPTVAEEWGFGHLATGGGIKVLLTGDSGTGKTLAAEVIAGELGTKLIKVDLARLVSKWVGETEKNLATAFSEAEQSHAVLFFDEADSLFGRRADVERGSDRYANLEVSYLLQCFEDYDGLVILASNLRENIDAAFTRRFHVALHFPRPEVRERVRLWRLALHPDAPVDDDVDLDLLARLDLTGGGIVSAARTAALVAANQRTTSISMAHLVDGVARQFKREARVLQPSELGPHASLLSAR